MKRSHFLKSLSVFLSVGLSLFSWGCRSSQGTSGNPTSPAVAVEKEFAQKWQGKSAAGFALTDLNGKKQDVSKEIGRRPVVLVFYRGIW